jgi:hypothetical protein
MRSQYFMTSNDLTAFVNKQAPAVTVVAITFDAASGQFVLFYTPGV